MTHELVSNSGFESRDRPETRSAANGSLNPVELGDDRYTLKYNRFNIMENKFEHEMRHFLNKGKQKF